MQLIYNVIPYTNTYNIHIPYFLIMGEHPQRHKYILMMNSLKKYYIEKYKNMIFYKRKNV